MYGLINKAIRGLVVEQFGQEAWDRIRRRAEIEDDDFVSMTNYDDSLTYDLVGAASEELGLGADAILEGFGGYWVRYTGVEGYGHLLDSAGSSLPEFLANLDQMHARVKLAFPDLKPPRFRVSDSDEAGLVLHYYSHRPGLAPLVIGLVKGLADRFGDVVEVEHLPMNTDGDEHDAFRVRYVSRGQGVQRS
ncbi:MAG: heme NO-binding protein [Phycisphaerae bacterium]|nr:heme NO-binding protein [Phycisphaerae bacterium]